MNKIQKAVTQINIFLKSENQSNSIEHKALATTYAQASKSLVARIKMCQDSLKNGDIAAAAQEAQTKPDIWTFAQSLHLSDFAAWVDICGFYEWDMPEEFDSSVLDFIKQELAMSQELAPMLNYYRAKIRSMSVSEKVNILRKIKKLDPKNEQWDKDLKTLEAEYIIALKERAKKAIQTHNVKDLNKVYAELNNEELQSKVGEKVLSGCKRKVQEFNGQKLKEQSNEILLKIDNAYAMQEREELAKELQHWHNEIENNEYFEFADIDIKILSDPEKWLENENKKIETEQSYKKSIIEFKSAMDNNEAMDKLETLFFNLNSFDDGVPPELNARYQSLCEDYSLQQERRSRNILVISVILLFFSVVTAWWLIGHFQHLNKKERIVKHISALLKDISIDDAETEFENLKKSDRNIYNSPEIKDLRHELAELQNKEKMRLNNLKRYLDILEGNASKGFNNIAQYKLYIEKIEPLIKSSEEQTKLNAIKDAYNQYMEEKRERDKNQFSIKIDEILGSLSEFEKDYLGKNEHEFNKKITTIMTQINELSELDIDKKTKQKGIRLVTHKIEKLKQSYKEFLIYKEKVNAFSQKIEKIVRQNKLRSFYDEINKFISTNGTNDSDIIYSKLLKDYPIAENLTALSHYNTKSFLGIKAIWQEVSDIGETNNPWYHPAKRLYDTVSTAAPSEVSKILQKKKFNFMQLYQVKFKNSKGLVYCYYSKKKPGRVRTNYTWIRTDKLSFCKIKDTWSIQIKPELKIPGFTLVSSWHLAANECWDKLIKSSMDIDIYNAEGIFIKWLGETVNNDEINPIFKCEMIAFVLSLMDSFAGKQPDLIEFSKNFKIGIQSFILKNDLSYSNLSPEQFRDLNLMIKDISLKNLQTGAMKRYSDNIILKSILGMQLSWAGIITQVHDLPKVILSSPGFQRQEIWMLTIKKDSKVQFKLIGVSQNGRFIPSVSNAELVPGNYLFSPKAGIDTKKIITEIKRKFDFKYIVWPETWPINCR